MASDKEISSSKDFSEEVIDQETDAAALRRESVARAVDLLRALSHTSRLQILCHLMSREHSVTELEGLLGERQSAVSQHLARLRTDGIVGFRREGKTIYYSIEDHKTASTVTHLHNLFCADKI
jgi:DNA-binding transcriptional ArsR family regulator